MAGRSVHSQNIHSTVTSATLARRRVHSHDGMEKKRPCSPCRWINQSCGFFVIQERSMQEYMKVIKMQVELLKAFFLVDRHAISSAKCDALGYQLNRQTNVGRSGRACVGIVYAEFFLFCMHSGVFGRLNMHL